MMISEVVIKDSASAVADRVTAAFGRMADAEGRANDNAVKSSRSLETAARNFENLSRAVNPVLDAQTRFADIQLKVQRAVDLGVASQSEAVAVIAKHKTALDDIIAKTTGSTNAFRLNAQG